MNTFILVSFFFSLFTCHKTRWARFNPHLNFKRNPKGFTCKMFSFFFNAFLAPLKICGWLATKGKFRSYTQLNIRKYLRENIGVELSLVGTM